ncbi:hypothetical protein ACWF7H_28460, partial [Peribacillus butanolivorans]
MAIKETEIWIKYHGSTIKYYEDKGYKFTTYIDNQNRIKVKRGTKILVKIEDLPKNSNELVTKVCDICGIEILKKQRYCTIIKNRNDGIDRCFKCGKDKMAETRSTANEDNCIANTHPEFAKLFWNQEDTYKYRYSTHKKADFKCQNCGNIVRNKRITDIYFQGLPCPCKDKISYPEKFMYSLLTQLEIEFEFQITFDWSKNIKTNNPKLDGTKRYDFYLNEINTIIETEGRQHFEETGFELLGGRTLQEEQENDRIKKSLAIVNEINNYIVIDCRESEIEFI